MKLKMLSAMFVSLLVVSGHSCPAQRVPSTQASCKPGNLTQEAPETIAKVTTFVTELQNAVRTSDKSRVAKMISISALGLNGNGPEERFLGKAVP